MDRDVRTVLMTADTVGGVFTYALMLAKELSTRGVAVHLATMGEPMRPAQRESAAAIASLVVHESTFALEWMDDPWDDVSRASSWLVALAREIAPDVVHMNGYANAAAGFDAPVVVGAHSCVLSWWEAALREPAPRRYDRYRRAVREGLDAADVVVAPTCAMLEALERHHGAVRGGRVIPNGARPVASPRRQPDKDSVVLAAGRLWDRAKNVDALVRVARRLPWPVKLAGWTAIERADARPVETDGVEFLGFCGPIELAAWMDRASIFAGPARYEPFGLTALEAALRGCALVLGDIPSLREVWGDAATFVAPDDDRALASAVARLADDHALRAAMAERALVRARRYRADACADATLALYRSLARRKELRTCA